MSTDSTKDWKRQRAAMQRVMRDHPNATQHERAIEFQAAVARQDRRKARLLLCLFAFFPVCAFVLAWIKWAR